jgi:hypothetical protein
MARLGREERCEMRWLNVSGTDSVMIPTIWHIWNGCLLKTRKMNSDVAWVSQLWLIAGTRSQRRSGTLSRIQWDEALSRTKFPNRIMP